MGTGKIKIKFFILLFFSLAFNFFVICQAAIADTCVYDDDYSASYYDQYPCPYSENATPPYECDWAGTYMSSQERDSESGYSSGWVYNMGYWVGGVYIRIYGISPSTNYYVKCAVIEASGYVVCLPDDDGDGIPNEYDLYPDSDQIYTAGISSILYNTTTGELVAGIITTDNGDKFTFGTIPSDLSGYTSESIEGDITMDSAAHLQANLENINGDLNLTNLSSSLDVAEDGTFDFNDFVSSTSNLPSLIIDNITADNAPVGSATDMQTGQASTGSETDNEALRKIVDNTKTSNDNQNRIADYLKINNDLLAQVSKKIGQSSTSVEITGESGPTANEIGQAVNDNLIDPTQTHDDSQTSNITGYDFGIKFADEKTKYSTRFTSFTDTFKNSTLFTLPGSLIGDIPSGGQSTFNVTIGKWGGQTDSIVSFDFQDYNSVWDTLKYILPILTAMAVLKILILKQH